MKKQKPRNRVALNPLLRKGGPHIASRSGERQRARQRVRRLVVQPEQ